MFLALCSLCCSEQAAKQIRMSGTAHLPESGGSSARPNPTPTLRTGPSECAAAFAILCSRGLSLLLETTLSRAQRQCDHMISPEDSACLCCGESFYSLEKFTGFTKFPGFGQLGVLGKGRLN